jgi:hypothetical protein
LQWDFGNRRKISWFRSGSRFREPISLCRFCGAEPWQTLVSAASRLVSTLFVSHESLPAPLISGAREVHGARKNGVGVTMTCSLKLISR